MQKRLIVCRSYRSCMGRSNSAAHRGAGALTAHTTQGARVGANVFIDSLDVSDLDLVIIGDGAVINEGATITGHYFKDGMLHFGAVRAQAAPGPAASPAHLGLQAHCSTLQPTCMRIRVARAVRARCHQRARPWLCRPACESYACHSGSHAFPASRTTMQPQGCTVMQVLIVTT